LLQGQGNQQLLAAKWAHVFRWGFATTSLRNGVDAFSLGRLMGHSDLSILRRYLTQTDADLEQAHRTAGPADNTLWAYPTLGPDKLVMDGLASGRAVRS
jgi:integrase